MFSPSNGIRKRYAFTWITRCLRLSLPRAFLQANTGPSTTHSSFCSTWRLEDTGPEIRMPLRHFPPVCWSTTSASTAPGAQRIQHLIPESRPFLRCLHGVEFRIDPAKCYDQHVISRANVFNAILMTCTVSPVQMPFVAFAFAGRVQ